MSTGFWTEPHLTPSILPYVFQRLEPKSSNDSKGLRFPLMMNSSYHLFLVFFMYVFFFFKSGFLWFLYVLKWSNKHRNLKMCVFWVSPVFFWPTKSVLLHSERILLIHPKVSLILATDMATHFDFLGKFRVRTSEQLTGRWMKGFRVPWYLYRKAMAWQ